MKTLLIITLVLILLPLAVLVINHIYVKTKLRKFASKKLLRIEPFLKKLDSNLLISQSEINEMVRDPALRYAIYRALDTYGILNLFPVTYLTREKAAESFLVNWLEFPTELGKAPDEIELYSKITVAANEPLEYFVFKYRTSRPHWAAQYDWMIGVCGPYRGQSSPYEVPQRVFSRFIGLSQGSPEAEVDWVHNNIGRG